MVRLARLSVSTLAGRTDIAHLSGHVGAKRDRSSHLSRIVIALSWMSVRTL